MTPPGAGTLRKAERLIAEGRVTVLTPTEPEHLSGVIVAWVRGDTGLYLTTVLHPAIAAGMHPQGGPYPACSCTCEAGRAGEHLCSHECALTTLLAR